MPHSLAFVEFKESLSMAEELLNIERNYNNPPRLSEQKTVRGLRGAVAVLIVASFEQFLKGMIEEQLSKLVAHPPITIDSIPDEMRVCHVFKTLDLAMKGPPFQDPPPKKDRIPDIRAASTKILSGIINPTAFTATGGNPSSKTIKLMFKELAMSNIFGVIETRFVQKWRKPIAHTFIVDKWDEIVNRRHIVAHTANALNITRNQLRESIRFSKILAELLDRELNGKVEQIIRGVRTP
jgi:hypothetical protein